MKKHWLFKVFISILIAVYLLTFLPFAIYGDSVLMSYIVLSYPIIPIIEYIVEILELEYIQSLFLAMAMFSALVSAILTAFIYVLSILLKKYFYKHPRKVKGT